MSPADPREAPARGVTAELRAGLRRLVREDPARPLHAGARLRNYFLTGLVVVGPVTITLYIAWWFINVVDAWVKPFVPSGLQSRTPICRSRCRASACCSRIVALTLIGALAANLLGRSLISVRRDDARRACRSCATSTAR